MNTSHSSTVRSLQAVARRPPSGLNSTELTESPCISGAPIKLPEDSSESRTQSSSPPVATLLPSGLNVPQLTGASWPNEQSSSPEEVSHSRAWLSPLSISTRPPSGLKAKKETFLSCRKDWSSASPVTRFQMRTTLVSSSVSSFPPSELNRGWGD